MIILIGIYFLIVFFIMTIFSIGSAAGRELDEEVERKDRLKKYNL